jgi:hypothetical protein
MRILDGYKKRMRNFIKSTVKQQVEESLGTLDRHLLNTLPIGDAQRSAFSEATHSPPHAPARGECLPRKFERSLPESRILFLKENCKLLSHHIDFFERAMRRIDFTGKQVMEIGGSNMPKQLLFEDLKAAKWICIDKPWDSHLRNWDEHYKNLYTAEKSTALSEALNASDYILYNMYTDDINDEFYGKFDVCVSNCSFEHITDMSAALRNIYSSLKPGGKLFARFGPVWSSALGSHFWLSNELNHANSGSVPPFAHLIMSFSEIFDLLKEIYTECDLNRINEMANAIKFGNNVNRYFFEDYEMFMDYSPFEHYSIIPYWEPHIDPNVRIKLSATYPQHAQYCHTIEIQAIKN